MLSLLHRTSLCYSRSVSVPVKHHIAQPPLGLGFRRRAHYVIAALKTGSSGSSARAGGQGSMGPYWLLKTEPGEWGWEHQEQNGGISQWDGVRNALAQIHLRSMRQGDHAFFYHSGGKGPAVVGVVEVIKAAYPDTSDDTGKSSMVDVRALAAFPQPVPLSVIKSDGAMRDWILLRQSRLSVMPVSPDVWQRVCQLGQLSPPLCRTTTENDAIPETEPERMAQPKRRKRGEEKADAQTKQKTSVNGASSGTQSLANHEEQSTQSEVAIVAELKTYQRSSRKRIAPSIVKTYKSRGAKKLPGEDTTLNPKP